MCHHHPHCPSAQADDRLAARITAARPEQGWSLLCNGVVVFDDSGVLLPDGGVIDPGPVRFGSRGLGLQSQRVGPPTQHVLGVDTADRGRPLRVPHVLHNDRCASRKSPVWVPAC
jgi:hypothetical protein